MITLICGMTPEAITLRLTTSPEPPSEATPSWMRAPPASNRPTIGARARIAMSWIFWIFSAWVPESEPPNTVKSLANTNTVRPFTVPHPVTTPSPGILAPLSMPNSVARCSTNMSNSSKESLSISSATRSRAVSLPRLCCASMRACPPPSRAFSRRTSSFPRMSFIAHDPSRTRNITLSLARELGNLNTSNLILRSTHRARLEGWPECAAMVRDAASRLLIMRSEEKGHDATKRRRRRRNAAPAAAHRGRGAGACRRLHVSSRRRELVVVRADPGARHQHARLFARHAARRHRVQRDAHHASAARACGARIPAALVRSAFDCAGLGRAYQHRSRARPRPEIRRGLRPHAPRPHRGRIGRELSDLPARAQDEDQDLGDGTVERLGNILAQLDLRQRLGERRILLDRHAVLARKLE